jgi:4-hydroxy-4-methyl-2-oxoglutarate aldolase
MSSTLLARLRALDICDLSDALDALKLKPALTGLLPMTFLKPIAGRAVTVKLAAGSGPAGSKRHLCTAAIEAAGPDNVILVEQRTGIDAAGWGGLLSRAAQHRGIAGTIVDGPTRDIEESVAANYPVYARSATARTARSRVHEISFNIEIMFGDLEVSPGDYVAVDSSGCAVIPASRIADVIERAEAIAGYSLKMANAIDAGIAVSKVMSGEYETLLQAKNRASTPSAASDGSGTLPEA